MISDARAALLRAMGLKGRTDRGGWWSATLLSGVVFAVWYGFLLWPATFSPETFKLPVVSKAVVDGLWLLVSIWLAVRRQNDRGKSAWVISIGYVAVLVSCWAWMLSPASPLAQGAYAAEAPLALVHHVILVAVGMWAIAELGFGPGAPTVRGQH